MLVISRKASESILLTDSRTGQTTTVRVLSLAGGKAKIGIEADRQVTVLRNELVGRDAANPPAA